MPFSLARFASLRPYAYHITAEGNLPRLRHGRLSSTAELLRLANRTDLLRVRRTSNVSIRVDGDLVMLKDQKPLSAASIAFESGWDLADLVEHLNCHVFFWPGCDQTPIAYGQRLRDHYQAESPSVIRVRTADLLAINSQRALFSAYNSGAPRWHPTKGPSPRGPSLFVRAQDFKHAAGKVVEIVFPDSATLPPSTQAFSGGCWVPLLSPAF